MVGLVVSVEYKWKDGVKNEVKGPKKKGGLAAALIWTGLILSYSRAGLGVALIATAFFAVLASRHRGRLRLLAAVLVLPPVLLLWQEVRLPGERFLSGEGDGP